MRTLDQIALSLPAVPDKASSGHGYLDVYETFLEPRRNQALKLLEIGVFEGASLALWSAYFPAASITGADKDITQCRMLPDRCRLWEMDQAHEFSIANMAGNLGPWDIIIDDGSHDPRHQVITFNSLWPHLNAGGLYCVEDLHVNYYPGYDGAMVRFLGGELQDDLHGRGKTGLARIENNPPEDRAKLRGREREVASIHLFRHLCIICKR